MPPLSVFSLHHFMHGCMYTYVPCHSCPPTWVMTCLLLEWAVAYLHNPIGKWKCNPWVQTLTNLPLTSATCIALIIVQFSHHLHFVFANNVVELTVYFLINYCVHCTDPLSFSSRPLHRSLFPPPSQSYFCLLEVGNSRPTSPATQGGGEGLIKQFLVCFVAIGKQGLDLYPTTEHAHW